MALNDLRIPQSEEITGQPIRLTNEHQRAIIAARNCIKRLRGYPEDAIELSAYPIRPRKEIITDERPDTEVQGPGRNQGVCRKRLSGSRLGNEATKTVEFHIPSRRTTDYEGRITNFSIVWTHPDFKAEFCNYYDEKSGDLPNFYAEEDTTDVGSDFVDGLESVDDLVAWLDRILERTCVDQ